jgi:N4-gp56 family major capsid protein
MFRGEIGKLGNIRFIETSEAKIWKDSTCPDGLAVFGTLVLGAHAYGVTELEGGGLEHIVKHLDIPTSLKEFGVPAEDLEGLVNAGMQVQRLLVNNMRPVTADDARKLYQEIM